MPMSMPMPHRAHCRFALPPSEELISCVIHCGPLHYVRRLSISIPSIQSGMVSIELSRF